MVPCTTLLPLRYFNEFTKAYHPFMCHMWMVLWKYVDPLIMLVIFFASVLREVIEPLTYAVYRNVSGGGVGGCEQLLWVRLC